MKSYITLYQNEIRAIEVTIRDQNDLVWEPSNATFKIIDSENNVVLEEATAMVESNKVYAIFPLTISSTCGEYDIIWKFLKVEGSNTYTYYHKTSVIVEEL